LERGRLLGLLAATRGRWAEAEWHFEAVLALNARIGARPWSAHTQHDYAVLLMTRSQPGDREKARALLNEALATARALDMHILEAWAIARLTPRPLLPQRPPYPDGLSPREGEVLRGPGQENRGIAEALGISLSTVATHVRNILSKTDSANRTEAAAYALRQGLVEG